MDPNETLRQLRESVHYYRAGYGKALGEANREELLAGLVEQVEALDGWLTRGGFMPTAWQRPRPLRPRADLNEKVTDE